MGPTPGHQGSGTTAMISRKLTTVAMIGIAAGASNMMATLPEIASNLLDLSRAASQSPWRNALQLLGNALSILYGFRKDDPVMKFFAASGATFALIAFIQTLTAK